MSPELSLDDIADKSLNINTLMSISHSSHKPTWASWVGGSSTVVPGTRFLKSLLFSTHGLVPLDSGSRGRKNGNLNKRDTYKLNLELVT